MKRFRERLTSGDARPSGRQRHGGPSPRSTRSSGAGRPTTGAWCRKRCSPRWINTCGSSPIDGRFAPIRTSRSTGQWAGTSGSSTRPGKNRWVFGDRDSGAYLRRLDWTKIVRHQMVLGTASPDDPSLAEYWAERRRRRPLPLSTPTRRLLQAQGGRCPACGELLLAADHEPRTPHEWEQWIKTTRKALRVKALTASRADGQAKTPDADTTNRLLHTNCAQREARRRSSRASKNPGTPSGLA